jgi:hypothetical protein
MCNCIDSRTVRYFGKTICEHPIEMVEKPESTASLSSAKEVTSIPPTALTIYIIAMSNNMSS